ncbi:MAG: hypothetical protein K2I73_01740 [Eubacterium sp.]|nr:hypothetical protein [Eubacterium sp.]
MKKDFKIFIIILFATIIIAGALVFLVGFIFFASDHTYKGIDEIEKGHCIFNADILDNVGNYEDSYYQIHHKNMAIFSSDASVLILKYNSENYESEKKKLEDDYIFLDAPVKEEDGEDYLISENEFAIDDWQFKVCRSDGWTEFEYPKYFRIIGYNEADNSIAYLDFDDSDLDIISESMEEFIDCYFDYDFRTK